MNREKRLMTHMLSSQIEWVAVCLNETIDQFHEEINDDVIDNLEDLSALLRLVKKLKEEWYP